MAWVASLVAETLPPIEDGKAPQTFEELWAQFDPQAEPLDVEVLKVWEEDGVVLKVLRYRIGIFKGQKAMMAAVYGYPKGGKNLPGLVQIHGGGQYAHQNACLTNAKRGYATISIAWAGRLSGADYHVNPAVVKLYWDGQTNNPQYRVTTDWGALDGYHAPFRYAHGFAQSKSHEHTLDDVSSPRNDSWFLCTLGARRALTFLERQPEVDGNRLGVYGHSMGGKLTVMTAGSDNRVKAAAPSCGGVSHRNDAKDPLINAMVCDDAYLKNITCPIMFLSPANDFHGRIEDQQTAFEEIESKVWRVTAAAHHQHQDTAEYEVATQIWFDEHLKGTFKTPKTPKSKLVLETMNGIPSYHVTPDSSRKILSVDIFYTQQADEKAQDRFWHHAKPQKAGDSWSAAVPILSTQKPLWVYANVLYALDAPITGAGYYYGIYTTSEFNLSSPMTMVTPQQLDAAGVKATVQPSPLIEDFGDDWEKEWYSYKKGRGHWERHTRKIQDDAYAAPAFSKLALGVQSDKAGTLIVEVDGFKTEVDLQDGAAWQDVVLFPTDFTDKNGSSRLDWEGIKGLRLAAGHGFESSAEAPFKLRNLRWAAGTREELNAHTAAVLLDVFPSPVMEMAADKQGTTALSYAYTPTDSRWGKHLDERDVFNFEIKHIQEKGNSFTARIGKGGQLYSLRGAFGESIPPQGVGNPWNDEVWQFVAVCGKYNGLDNSGILPESAADRLRNSPYEGTYFIHNSGAYMGTHVDSGTITLSCDVRLDPDATVPLSIILRDISTEQWKTLATLHMDTEQLALNGKPFGATEAGVWHSVTLSFKLGADSDRTLTATVTPHGGEGATVTMPFEEKDIRVFNWLGLSAAGTTRGVIHVDNLCVERVTGATSTWPLKEDFDDYPVGGSFAYIAGEDKAKGGTAFVSDSVAVSGKNSLEIHDAPDLAAGWAPVVRVGVLSTRSGSLYCPLLAADVPDDGRTYRTVNWGIVPQLKTIHRSPILYYVQTRDVGEGVIEVTYVVHNFSARDDIVFDWLNAPWGGTRISALPYHYVSSATGELWDRQKSVEMNLVNGIDVRKTGGWNLSCATEADDSPSLALVFGRDRHLDAELERAAKGQPHCQISHSIYRDMISPLPEDLRLRPEHTWRNYDPAVVIPRLNLAPGKSIWYRSYLVVNRKDRAIELAKSLVDKVDYGYREFDPATTPMVSVIPGEGEDGTRSRPTGDVGRDRVPAIEIFAHPVPGTMPLFLIQNATTGQEVITTDPYIFVPQEKLDLGVPPEHPKHDYYNQAVGYSLDENNTNWKRILGYAYVDKPEGDDFVRLSELLDENMFPAANTYHLDLWMKRN